MKTEFIFPLVKFAGSWLLFLLFADKKRYIFISPTCYLAVIFALITDLLMFVYPLWEYPADSKLGLFTKQMLNSFGIYFVVTYFFIQMLPKSPKLLGLIKYILYWSIFSIVIEVAALWFGYIKHEHWWNLSWSFASDLILFSAFYLHYKWREKKTG
jgi:hypothetical protein